MQPKHLKMPSSRIEISCFSRLEMTLTFDTSFSFKMAVRVQLCQLGMNLAQSADLSQGFSFGNNVNIGKSIRLEMLV